MRKTALKILNDTESGAYLNLAFQEGLKDAHLSAVDTAFVKELVFGVFRNKILLDYVIRKNSSIRLKKIDSKILNILRMGAYQLYFMDKVPDHATVSEAVNLAKKISSPKTASFVNAVLRSMVRGKDTSKEIDLSGLTDKCELLSVKYSYPAPLCRFFVKFFGEEAEDLMKYGNLSPELCVRVNTLKITKSDFIKN